MDLADTSAWTWTRRVGGDVREVFDERLAAGELGTCDMIRFELLYSARSFAEFVAIRAELEELPDLPAGKRQWKRALDVYEELAERAELHHRAVPYPDLLIAAAAESRDVAVLHYDEDFDRIAEITGQEMRWLAPRGSLD